LVTFKFHRQVSRPATAVLAGIAFCLGGSLAGCGPVLKHGTPLTEVLAQEKTAATGPYRLQPGDQLEVHHILDPDYSALIVVAPDGKITVPGIPGQVQAQGQTVNGLTDQLNTLYRKSDVLSRPFFSVNLRSFASLQVFVGGEVQRPGYLELAGGDRHVMQVITSGGGFLPTARRDEVIVLRRLQDGSPEIFSVDLDKVVSGTDLTQDVRIQPMDVVIVPKSDIAQLDTFVDQYIRQALPLQSNFNVTYTNNPNSSIFK
jgi:protein involved in polysaccharide export with SLBB domain